MCKFFSNIWKHIPSRVWMIVSASVVVVMLVLNIFASTWLFNTLCVILNSPVRMEVSDDGFESPFKTIEGAATREAAAAYGDQITKEVCAEGFTLLKNSGNALPLSTGARVSVFGKNSVNMATGGSGSGGSSGEGAKNIFDSLTAAGFLYNDSLKSFYESSASGSGRGQNPSDLSKGGTVTLATGETAWTAYTESVKTSCNNYKDAAIIVITRIGGEGFDLPRSYLKLDDNETRLITEVKAMGFGKVVVLLNAANAMEVHSIKNDNGIDAMLWIGYAGNYGIMALGDIFNGTVSPSGHTVDTYATLDSNPTWKNFGGEEGKVPVGNQFISGDAYIRGTAARPIDSNTYFVDYEETIYVGYRYYETAYAENIAGRNSGFSYDDAVAYPFGYGLSYTSFDWTLENPLPIGSTITKTTSMTFNVKVKNTGAAAGRDVVQIYVTPPYTPGGIEKSAKVLVGFAKTKVLAAGEEQTVSVTVDSPYAYASYDCYDKNKNGFKGYEVESGTYTFTISTDAHTAKGMTNAQVTASVNQGFYYDEGKVGNLYTDNADESMNMDTELSTVLSRQDFVSTWPTTRTSEEKKVDQAFVTAIESAEPNPNNPTQYTTVPRTGDDSSQLMMSDMVGLDYDDENWDKFLDRLTLDEMVKLVNEGAFQTLAIERLGVPLVRASDGPVGWVNFIAGIKAEFVGCCKYCCEVVLASTWNVDRLFDMGQSVGNEGLVGSKNGPFSGWYAPGLNIHRSPMGGRNFEYYSEDPFLSGQMTAAVMKGAYDKGVYVNLKHFAMNEQETHRQNNGLLTWGTEQSLREIYLKSFEIAIKTAQKNEKFNADGTRSAGTESVNYAVRSMGVMSSFNRIGTRWTGGDYRLLTQILREEWGFRGLVICDFNTCSHMVVKDMVYAGGDLNLEMIGQQTWKNPDPNSAADVSMLRQAAKNIIYVTANSNAYRGDFVLLMPIWQIVMIVIDCVFCAGIIVWGFFVVRKALKKSKQ